MKFFGKTVEVNAEQDKMNKERLALGRQINALEKQLKDHNNQLLFIRNKWATKTRHPEGMYYGDAEQVYTPDNKAKMVAECETYTAKVIDPLKAEIAKLKAEQDELTERLCVAVFGYNMAEFHKRAERERIEREIANIKTRCAREVADCHKRLAALG